jgi:hypothetical protein
MAIGESERDDSLCTILSGMKPSEDIASVVRALNAKTGSDISEGISLSALQHEINSVIQLVIDRLQLGHLEVDHKFIRATEDLAVSARNEMSNLEKRSNRAPAGDVYRELKRLDTKLNFCLELLRLNDLVRTGSGEVTDIPTAADDAGSVTSFRMTPRETGGQTTGTADEAATQRRVPSEPASEDADRGTPGQSQPTASPQEPGWRIPKKDPELQRIFDEIFGNRQKPRGHEN